MDDISSELAELPVVIEEENAKREECSKCLRPVVACWCPFLPDPPLDVNTNIVILQHPLEVRRALRTAPMVQLGVAPGKCTVYRGKKFPLRHHQGLPEILASPRTVILFPGPHATDVADLPAWDADDTAACHTHTGAAVNGGGEQTTSEQSGPRQPYNVLILDGTWRQAKTMYTLSPALHNIKQVMVSGRQCSSYVVRTQPAASCLSTLEAAAACLQVLERRPQLGPALLQPLHQLCRVQLAHGAVRHTNKQDLIERGVYERQRGVRTNRMFRQLGVVL